MGSGVLGSGVWVLGSGVLGSWGPANRACVCSSELQLSFCVFALCFRFVFSFCVFALCFRFVFLLLVLVLCSHFLFSLSVFAFGFHFKNTPSSASALQPATVCLTDTYKGPGL